MDGRWCENRWVGADVPGAWARGDEADDKAYQVLEEVGMATRKTSAMKKVLDFLTDLSVNNNREWYHANKDRYNESKEKILFLTEVLINEIRKFDPDIPVLEPKDCVFRI